MKKRVILVCLISAFSLAITYYFVSRNKVSDFSVSEYYEYTQRYSSDMVLGAVENEQEARDRAYEVWTTILVDVNTLKPFVVQFDIDEGVWLVCGSLPAGYVGGVPYILIRKSDGKVLAMWHTQ